MSDRMVLLELQDLLFVYTHETENRQCASTKYHTSNISTTNHALFRLVKKPAPALAYLEIWKWGIQEYFSGAHFQKCSNISVIFHIKY